MKTPFSKILRADWCQGKFSIIQVEFLSSSFPLQYYINEDIQNCIIACCSNGFEISSLIIEGGTWAEGVCE